MQNHLSDSLEKNITDLSYRQKILYVFYYESRLNYFTILMHNIDVFFIQVLFLINVLFFFNISQF